MNEIITNLMNQWGFDMPMSIFNPMVYIISTIAFCLVFWIISKIACPNASHMRSFIMKYTCIVTAVVVCLSCLATNGITINTDKEPIIEEPSIPTLNNGYYIVKSDTQPIFTTYKGDIVDIRNSVTTETLSIIFVPSSVTTDIAVNGDPITLERTDCILVDSGMTIEILDNGICCVVPITTYTIQEATQ